MRYGLWFFAALAVLVLSGMAALYLVNVHDLPGVQEPTSYTELDPDVATLVRQSVSDVRNNLDDPLRWVRLGMVYEANDLPTLAQQTYRAVTVRFSNDSRGWFGLARVNASLGELDGAENAMRRAIKLEPDYAPAHWRLGYWLFEQGQVDEAALEFQQATHLEKDDPAAWFGLARIQLARGDTQAAVTALEWLTKAPPPNGPYAWQLLSGAYRQLGRMDDAETASLRGQGAAPQFRDPWQVEVDQLKRGFGAQLNQAKALLTFGRIDDAIALLKKLHERRPDDPMVLNNLATAYRAVGRLDESEQALDEALAIQPQFIHAHFGKAMNLRTSAQTISRQLVVDNILSEALAELDRTLELNASYAPAYALRGEILAMQGKQDEAAVAYERAYRLQPQQVSWLADAAQSRLSLGEYEQAAALLDTVTRQAPTMAQAWVDYSTALKHLNRLDEAAAALDHAQAISPNDEAVQTARKALKRRIEPEAIGP